MVNMTSKGPRFAHGISISVWENGRPWELWNQAAARRCKLICYNPEYYFWLSPKWKLSLAGAFWVLFWVLYNFFVFILCLLLPGNSSTEQSEKALNLESKHFGDSWYHLWNWVWFLQIAKKKKKICLRVRFVFKERKEWESGPGVFHCVFFLRRKKSQRVNALMR